MNRWLSGPNEPQHRHQDTPKTATVTGNLKPREIAGAVAELALNYRAFMNSPSRQSNAGSRRRGSFRSLFLGLTLVAHAGAARGADQPQWGQAWTRNMVSGERGLPDSFDPRSGKNIRWVAKIGTETHSTPIISGGRIYLGTNNGEPRDPKHQGDRGVLMCFNEADGKLLWQLVVPKREEDPYHDWPKCGISSPATVEGDRVYLVDNRGVVLCLDVHGMANGNDGPFRDEGAYMTPRGTNAPAQPLTPGPLDADILWALDLTKEAGIWSHDAAHSSILIRGDHLYLNSGTGVDNTHVKIRTPDAPSLVVVDKKTGRLLARERLGIAPNILARRLSALSDAGLIEKRRYSERPPRDEYLLTDAGRDFLPILMAIGAWGRKHNGGGALSRHLDAETGEAVRPLVVDANTGAPIGSRPLRFEIPE